MSGQPTRDLPPIAWDREESGEPCQRLTPGCAVDHQPGTDYACEGW